MTPKFKAGDIIRNRIDSPSNLSVGVINHVLEDCYLAAFNGELRQFPHEQLDKFEKIAEEPVIKTQLKSFYGNMIDHPKHYGGEENTYEAIKVIEAWNLGFCLGNTIKYISRAGKKNPDLELEDLKKAKWYLDREIERRENGN